MKIKKNAVGTLYSLCEEKNDTMHPSVLVIRLTYIILSKSVESTRQHETIYIFDSYASIIYVDIHYICAYVMNQENMDILQSSFVKMILISVYVISLID